MYNIQYFNQSGLDTSTPKFHNIQTMIDYINHNPNLNYSIVLYDNHMVAFEINDIIHNGKPRRSFINSMNRRLSLT